MPKHVKVILGSIFFISCWFSILPSTRADIGPSDIKYQINTPTITLPDYSKNECPICSKDYIWMGDNGCCKQEINMTDKSGEYIYDCKQPDIVTCNKDEVCISGQECLLVPQNAGLSPLDLCNRITDVTERNKCLSCMYDNQHVWSGLGCIPTDISSLISYFLSLGLMLGGGISFLMFIYGSFKLLTSEGDVEQVKKSKKIITSAIKGLLLIIFALFIIRLLTVNILKLPGFE